MSFIRYERNCAEPFSFVFAKLNSYIVVEDIERKRVLQLTNDIDIISKRNKSLSDKITSHMGYKLIIDYAEYQNRYNSVPEEYTTAADFFDFPFIFLDKNGIQYNGYDHFSLNIILIIRLGIELYQSQLLKLGKYQQFLKKMILSIFMSQSKKNKHDIINYLNDVFISVNNKLLAYSKDEYWDLFFYWHGSRGYIKGFCPNEKKASKYYKRSGDPCRLKYFYPFRNRCKVLKDLRGGVYMQILSLILGEYSLPDLELNEGKEEKYQLGSSVTYNAMLTSLAVSQSELESMHDSKNKNPLQLVMLSGNQILMNYLVQRFRLSNYNIVDDLGNSLTHFAVQSRNPFMIDWCAKSDMFQPHVKNKHGKTPLNLAKNENNYAMVSRIAFHIDKGNLESKIHYPSTYEKLLRKVGSGIENILDDYTKKSYFHWRRHHKALVTTLKSKARNQPSHQVIQHLIEEKTNLINQCKLNPSGSFARRANFIIKKYRSSLSIEDQDCYESKMSSSLELKSLGDSKKTANITKFNSRYLPDQVLENILFPCLDAKTMVNLSSCNSGLFLQCSQNRRYWKEKIIAIGYNPNEVEIVSSRTNVKNYQRLYRNLLRLSYPERINLTATEIYCLCGEQLTIFEPHESSLDSKFDVGILHYAALSGSIVSVKYVVEVLKASPSAKDRYGANVLHYAAWGGSIEVINYLKKFCTSNRHDDKGCNELYYAALSGSKIIMKYVIETLKVTIFDDHDHPRKRTPLSYAMRTGSVEAMKFAFEILGYQGRSWYLLEAARYGSVNGMKFAVEILKISPTISNRFNVNALHCAAQSGSVEAIMYALTVLNISATSVTINNTNILHYAARSGSLDAIRYVIEELKISVASIDNLGVNILHCAAESGSVEAVCYIRRLIYESKSALDFTLNDNNGHDVFWYAGEMRNTPAIISALKMPINELLLQSKCGKQESEMKLEESEVKSGSIDSLKFNNLHVNRP